jgi:hypothetical protein
MAASEAMVETAELVEPAERLPPHRQPVETAASEAMVETAELVEVPAPLWVLARSA